MGIVTAHLFWAYVAYSQRSQASFGPYVETPTPVPPVSVAIHATATRPLPVILVTSAGRTGVETYTLTSGGRCLRQGAYPTARVPAQIALADVDADGTDEIISLSADGYHVEVLATAEGRGVSAVYRLEHRAQRFVVADINNDRWKDLLLFGRNMAGIDVLTGSRTGTFTAGPLLFPEASVSDVVAVDLNGDRLTDLVVVQWLSDRLVFTFGLGHSLFTEQVSLDLPAEPGRISFMSVNKRQTLRFLVTLPGMQAVAHVIGDPTGAFALRETIPVPGDPLAVGFALINDDLLPDMVATTTAGMAVALGNSSVTFSAPTIFGAGAESSSWTLGDVDGDGKTDIVMADGRGRRIVVLGNAYQSGLAAWPREYAAGIAPAAVTVTDWTDDGVEDVLVANAGSSTISLFTGTQPGRLQGQRSLAVPGSPGELATAHDVTGRPVAIVAVDPVEEKLVIARRNGVFEQARVLTLATAEAPRLLRAEIDRTSGRLLIAVRNGRSAANRSPLALYEEIAGQQFIERTYRFTLPTTITAMASGDLIGNGKDDLFLGLRERQGKQASVALAPAQLGYDFRRIQSILTLPDTAMTLRLLTVSDADQDGVIDVLMFTGQPGRMLGLAYGGPGGVLAFDSTWIDGVNPADETALVVRDVNGDGWQDIVYLDVIRDAVYALYGMGVRRFADPVLVLPADGAESFALRQAAVSGDVEIVLAHRKRNTITVHQGAFGS